jgi:hypothetical protein
MVIRLIFTVMIHSKFGKSGSSIEVCKILMRNNILHNAAMKSNISFRLFVYRRSSLSMNQREIRTKHLVSLSLDATFHTEIL